MLVIVNTLIHFFKKLIIIICLTGTSYQVNAQFATIIDVMTPIQTAIIGAQKFMKVPKQVRGASYFGVQIARNLAMHFRHTSIRFYISPKFGVYLSTLALTDAIFSEATELIDAHNSLTSTQETQESSWTEIRLPLQKAEYVLHREDYYYYILWNETPNLFAASVTGKYGESLVSLQMMQYRLDLIFLRVTDAFKNLLDMQEFIDFINENAASHCNGRVYTPVDTGWKNYQASGSKDSTAVAFWTDRSSPDVPTVGLGPGSSSGPDSPDCIDCNNDPDKQYIGDCAAATGYCLDCSSDDWLEVENGRARCCIYDIYGGSICDSWVNINGT